jgi:hypothetical protein
LRMCEWFAARGVGRGRASPGEVQIGTHLRADTIRLDDEPQAELLNMLLRVSRRPTYPWVQHNTAHRITAPYTSQTSQISQHLTTPRHTAPRHTAATSFPPLDVNTPDSLDSLTIHRHSSADYQPCKTSRRTTRRPTTPYRNQAPARARHSVMAWKGMSGSVSTHVVAKCGVERTLRGTRWRGYEDAKRRRGGEARRRR